MFKHPKIAVDGCLHPLQESRCRVSRAEQRLVSAHPALPRTHQRLRHWFFCLRKNQIFEPRKPPTQGTNAALSCQSVLGENDAPEKVNPLSTALHDRLVGMNGKPQPFLQKNFDRESIPGQCFRIISEKHEIIDVTQVSFYPKFVFDVTAVRLNEGANR